MQYSNDRVRLEALERTYLEPPDEKDWEREEEILANKADFEYESLREERLLNGRAYCL